MPDNVQTPSDPFTGQVLAGRYLPRSIVQRSADSIVYDAIDQTTRASVRIQRPVALRLSQEQVPKVHAASQLIAKLKAVPGAICPTGGGIHAGVPFLVLPPLASGTLADRLRLTRGGADAGAATRSVRLWLKPIALTLDAVHKLGLCHGRLQPGSIALGTDGAAQIDGLPFSQLLHSLGATNPQHAPDDPLSHYVAPEVASGGAATAASDQYSLAEIVASSLGVHTKRPKALEKALSARPTERFASCRELADALLAELEVTKLGSKTSRPHFPTDAPLELEDLDPPAPGSLPNSQLASATQELDLELDSDEDDAQLRKSRKTSFDHAEDDLLDVTFTQPGESLLTKKSTYAKAVDLSKSRAAWRRMREEFTVLSSQKKIAVRAIVGIVAMLCAFWILQAGWRAARFLVDSGQALTQNTLEKLQPNIAVIEKARQQVTENVRNAWNEVQPAGEGHENAAEVAPKADNAPIQGEPWPTRDQDKLSTDQLVGPSEVIAGIMEHKGVPLTPNGLGVFHVDAPMTAEKPAWIGGFGLEKKPGVPMKALLHGTVVHHAEDESVFAGRYLQGDLQDFWLVTSPDGKRLVAYARIGKGGNPLKPDGAAFVIDEFRTTCLAFVNKAGKVMGAQWCKKKQDLLGRVSYEPPTDIAAITTLEAENPRVADYEACLRQACEKVVEIQREALSILRQHKKKIVE